jgi:hypothetical protein
MFNPQPKEKDCPKQENLIPVTEYRNTFLKGARKKNKYHAKKQTYDGIKFDSTLEAKVYEELLWQQKAGDIVEIKRQVKIPLMVNRILVTTYFCDFRVIDKHGQVKYIEAKGLELPAWKIKKKLFLALLPEIDNGAIFEMIR